MIDYRSDDSSRRSAPLSPGVDKALNGVAGETANQAVQAVRPGGQMVDLTGSATAARPGVRVIRDYVVRADGTRLASIARMIEAGHQGGGPTGLPLRNAARRLELVQSKHVRGKIVLGVA